MTNDTITEILNYTNETHQRIKELMQVSKRLANGNDFQKAMAAEIVLIVSDIVLNNGEVAKLLNLEIDLNNLFNQAETGK